MKTLFDCNGFLEFLRAQIDDNSTTRGYQSRLAEAARCQRSFLSQILHAAVLPTPDHALGMCAFWNLGQEETQYYLDLVNLARAQSQPLQQHLKKRLRAAQAKRRDIASRVNHPAPTLGDGELTEYYSAWYYAAIHIATGLRKSVTPEKLAESLPLPLSVVTHVLKQLEAAGLVQKHGARWRCITPHLHLPKTSVLTRVNHLNWRQRAMDATHFPANEGLRYSLVFSASRKDIEEMEKKILELIEGMRKTIAQSPEDELVCFLCDYFVLMA